MVSGILHRVIVVLGLGATFVSVSEYWFYKVDDEVDSVLILLAYGLLGGLFLATLHRFRVQSLAGLAIASALLGFLIEGVAVPVVYAAPPLSIVWTSLAWHYAISIGLGWVAYRWCMIRGGILQAAGYNAAFGIFLGFWNAFMWNANEIEGTGEITFLWLPIEAFVAQFLFGYLLFLGGHALLDRLYPLRFRLSRTEHLGLWFLASAMSITVAYASGLLALFPILPALVGLCLLLLRKEARAWDGSDALVIDRIYEERIPTWRFGLSLLIPLAAIATYAALVTFRIELEMNVIIIVTAGPAAVATLVWSAARLTARTQ